MKLTNVNIWLSENLTAKTPAKLLGGLALGALLITATALPLGSIQADEPNQPLVSEKVVIDPEEGPFGAITGYVDEFEEWGMAPHGIARETSPVVDRAGEYVDEFEEWGMVLDGTSRATSPVVDRAGEYVDEFEEWGMVLHGIARETSPVVDLAGEYVDEFEEWGMAPHGIARETSPVVDLAGEYVDEFEEWGMTSQPKVNITVATYEQPIEEMLVDLPELEQ
ncbi:MAG: hypothetical protein ACE5Q6_09535 [Dehalococcoidia bacterium]